MLLTFTSTLQLSPAVTLARILLLLNTASLASPLCVVLKRWQHKIALFRRFPLLGFLDGLFLRG
jgi:hypothetical protein